MKLSTFYLTWIVLMPAIVFSRTTRGEIKIVHITTFNLWVESTIDIIQLKNDVLVFQNPDGELVIVIANLTEEIVEKTIRIGEKIFRTSFERHSVIAILFNQ